MAIANLQAVAASLRELLLQNQHCVAKLVRKNEWLFKVIPEVIDVKQLELRDLRQQVDHVSRFVSSHR